MLVFYGEKLFGPHLGEWMTTPFWLSVTAYSVYSQLPSISESLLPHLKLDVPYFDDK
jgi:hypothetical protein